MAYIRLVLIAFFIFLCSVSALIFNLVDRSFGLYFWLTRILGNGVLFLAGVEYEVLGAENIDTTKTYVYVSNHSSMFDIPAIMAAVPTRASIIFKKELARIPFFGWALVTGPYVLINRQKPEKAMKSSDHAKKLLTEKGVSMILYAEGTRSKTGEVLPFKRGAFHLASMVSHPIVPVSIKGADKVMPKGKFNIVHGKIQVIFDKPIEFKGPLNRKEEIELMDRVREIVIRNKEE
ncbi:MAG: 1-acyl-sn-glycerol-3-phosphate acyltransferase [Ignavibacteriales bacterium]|nr:1-acyl-sn-glycerol-3-phosphate acyltransferase [Ignavibacteriales bacterium]